MDAISTATDIGSLTPEDAAAAAEACDLLLAAGDSDPHLQVDGGAQVRLPRAAAVLLRDMLAEMARGNAVALLPVQTELTTQQAAHYLNVSRPYLIGLLEKRAIPFHKVGTHRRVTFADLAAYRKQSRARSGAAMDELVAQAQELELGY
jgi:excisionase family DNA binding protein